MQKIIDFQTSADGEISYSITEHHVKSALDVLLFGRYLRTPNPLEQLESVNRIITDPAFPPCLSSRTIALGDILTSIVTAELGKHREVMRISSTLSETSINDAFGAIARDSNSSNRELMGWSWLYYRYVRVELGIQAKVFAQLCHISERTLKRYQAHILQRLANILIIQEWEIRRFKQSQLVVAQETAV